ncbi:MAG TPA: hypothetical protein DF383_05605 [Deltaproteobacteria bacterium]|nr:hypothetical protein [Deltaproteobacteria bacterium]
MNSKEDFPERDPENAEVDAWLCRWRETEIPPLSPGFKARVMAELQARGGWRRFREKWLTLPRLAFASALGLALVLSLWLRREPLQGPSFPGFAVREDGGGASERLYRVRFAVKDPDAKGVAVAGDFNQWNPVNLSPSGSEQGLYTVELSIPEGTYNYAFVIDGKQWLADLAAERLVEDGFGRKNSVIRL